MEQQNQNQFPVQGRLRRRLGSIRTGMRNRLGRIQTRGRRMFNNRVQQFGTLAYQYLDSQYPELVHIANFVNQRVGSDSIAEVERRRRRAHRAPANARQSQLRNEHSERVDRRRDYQARWQPRPQ